MRREALLLSFLLVVLAEVSPAATQSPASKPARPAEPGGTTFAADAARRDPSVLAFDAPGDGSLWVRGANYKAGFTSAGASVHPALGARVPSRPLAMRPLALSSGGRPVAFGADAQASRSGATFTYDRGSFLERYEASSSSIEQSFVFATLPSRGELVLSIEVESALVGRETDAGLRFECDAGGLDYGRAVAIEAGGRSRSLATRVSSSGIEIRVPAEFLAAAGLPLVIDPVITTFPIDTTANDDFAPDVAYDASTGITFVCYEEAYSANDHDVYSHAIDLSGAFVSGQYLDFTADDWRHPRVANNEAADQFMAAAHRGTPGARSIAARTFTVPSFALGPQVTVAPAFFNYERVNPDIGGNPAPSGDTRYLVAFEEVNLPSGDRTIVQVVMNTAGAPGSPICIDCDPGRRFNPAVSKSAGLPGTGVDNRWNVVWEYEFAPNDHDIYCAQQANGLLVTQPFALDTSPLDERFPSVSSYFQQGSSVGTYAAVYQRNTGNDYDIHAVVAEGGTWLSAANLSALEGPSFAGQWQSRPDVDSDGAGFVVAYSELYSTSSTDWDVYASTFTRTGVAIVPIEVHQNLAFTSLPEVDVQVSARPGSGTRLQSVAWTQGTTGSGDIYGGTFASALFSEFCFPGSDGVATCPCANPPTGAGCENSGSTGGATISATGMPSLGADTFELSQTGELPNSLSIFLQGDVAIAAGTAFGGGVRCTGGALKRLYVRAASAGAVSAPGAGDPSISTVSALLGAPIQAGETRYYQIYYRDPNTAFCPAGFNVGNAIRALWVP